MVGVMGFFTDLFTLAKETPDQRRKREREGRVISKPKPQAAGHPNSPYERFPPTSHPDDHYGFEGLDAYAAGKAKGKKRK